MITTYRFDTSGCMRMINRSATAIAEPFPGAHTVFDLTAWPAAVAAQSELPLAPRVELPQSASTLTNAADQQPMPEHLNPAERSEIELLLLRIFRQDTEAIRFLSNHNAGLRAKPLDLIQRDKAGVATVLDYLRQAAGNQAATSSALAQALEEK